MATSPAPSPVSPKKHLQQKHLVTRSGIFYYRKAVPLDLKHHYQKRELTVSLKTSHKEAALLLFSSMESKMQMEFAMLRSGNLSQVSSQSHQQSHQQSQQQIHLQNLQGSHTSPADPSSLSSTVLPCLA